LTLEGELSLQIMILRAYVIQNVSWLDQSDGSSLALQKRDYLPATPISEAIGELLVFKKNLLTSLHLSHLQLILNLVFVTGGVRFSISVSKWARQLSIQSLSYSHSVTSESSPSRIVTYCTAFFRIAACSSGTAVFPRRYLFASHRSLV